MVRLNQPDQIDKPIVKTSQSARGGVISGRVIGVLIISLVLAVIVSVTVIGYFHSGEFTTPKETQIKGK